MSSTRSRGYPAQGEKIRLGLAGCEREGIQLVAETDRLREAGAVVTSLYDKDPQRLDEMARRFGIEHKYSRIEELIAADTCDAVLSFEASTTRETTTYAALNAGLHIYSDKPYAFSLERAEELSRVAYATNTHLLSAPAITKWPLWMLIKDLLEEGAIGRPIGLRARFDSSPWPWPGWDGDPTWYFGADMGPLRDLGPYPIHLALDLFGRIRTVSAASSQLIPQRVIAAGPRKGDRFIEEGEDMFSLALGFEDREFALIHVSYCAHGSRAPRCEVLGEFGSLSFNPTRASEGLIIRRVADYEAEVSREEVTPEEILDRTGGGKLGLDLFAGVDEFLNVIRSDRWSPLGAERSLQVVTVIEEALHSAESFDVALTNSGEME